MSCPTPTPFFSLPLELRNHIYASIWSSTLLLIYKSSHVLAISHGPLNTSAHPHLPTWLLTSRAVFTEGLAEFARGAVCTCIKPVARLQRPVHAHVNGDAENELLRRVREVRLDLAVRCYEKQLRPDSAYFAHFIFTPRDEYWCTLLPLEPRTRAEPRMRLRKFLPSATRLTLQVECQNLEWVVGPHLLRVMWARGMQVLGTRWRSVRLEVAPLVVESEVGEDGGMEVPCVAAIRETYGLLIEKLVELAAMFTRTHVANLDDSDLERVLNNVYVSPRVWATCKHLMSHDDPEIKNEKLAAAMRTRPQRQQIFRTWTDSDSGAWTLDISTITNQSPITTPAFQLPSLTHFFISLPTNERATFTLDTPPKRGTISYSCPDTNEVLWYERDANATGYMRDNGPEFLQSAPEQPGWRQEYRISTPQAPCAYMINAPERRGGDHRCAEWQELMKMASCRRNRMRRGFQV
jgi:hypothetical protein